MAKRRKDLSLPYLQGRSVRNRVLVIEAAKDGERAVMKGVWALPPGPASCRPEKTRGFPVSRNRIANRLSYGVRETHGGQPGSFCSHLAQVGPAEDHLLHDDASAARTVPADVDPVDSSNGGEQATATATHIQTKGECSVMKQREAGRG